MRKGGGIKTRLGLDLGTNSLGWSLLELDQKGEPFKIVKTGVRIFSSGRDAKTNTTLNAERREKRSARRRRDRYLQRRSYLMKILVKIGFMPSNEDERKKLQILNPYELRAKALDQKIDIHGIGRIFFHLNQRRGFQSNRKDASDKDSGDMKESIKQFKEMIGEKGCRTMGEYLYLFDRDSWDREKGRRKPIRARRRGENKGLYDFYPERNMLKDEFHAIWDYQKKFYDDDDIFSKDNEDKIFNIIFHQRPLKPPIIGKCSFVDGEDRAPKALISFQKSRLWQEINTLKYRNSSEYRFKEIPIETRRNLVTGQRDSNKPVITLSEKMEFHSEKYSL